MYEMRILIIGGGAAGTTAATRLRRLNENDEILILEKDDEISVSNCGLNYYLAGTAGRDDLISASVELLKKLYNIDARLNSEVTNINRENKTVSIAGQDDEYYDKLIVTIGSAQYRPDIDGVLTDQVFTIHNLASVERIKDFIKLNEVKKAVIVGGGYIGVEMSESLRQLDIETSIVESSNHILPALDYDMAVTLHNHLRENGIRLYLNESVIAFDDKKVSLSSGKQLDYDIAIIATGSKPDVKLGILAELEIGDSGGLKVNEYMQTSDKDIYAAGDDVEVTNFITRKPTRMAQAGLAVKQAQVIADHLGGEKSKFTYALNTAISKIFRYTAAAVGANEKILKDAGIAYQSVLLYDWTHAPYLPGSELVLLKLLFDKNGKILGAQGIGKNGIDKRLDIISMAIKMNAKVWDLQELEVCYSPPFSRGKDAVNNLASMAANILEKRMKTVSFQDIDSDKDMMIIDVRSKADFDDYHLPNAVNIPVEAIRSNLDSIPHDKKVVLYCMRGRTAYIASCILTNRGFDNIYILDGGLMLYSEIIKDKTESKKIEN